MQVSQQVTSPSQSEFLIAVNAVCCQVAFTVKDDRAEHTMFMWECAKQQLRKHDPKARSYGVVAQLVDTNPRAW